MTISLEVEGLDELREKYKDAPERFRAGIFKATEGSLLVLHENVPPYPTAKPDSTYTRTGTLGRTLGSSFGGGASGGKPDIYEVRQQGSDVIGEFGTRLVYAPYVIGEQEQAAQHRGRWWTIKTIAERAQAKIERVFQIAAEELAKWLDANGR
jgi:hypothetical protein